MFSSLSLSSCCFPGLNFVMRLQVYYIKQHLNLIPSLMWYICIKDWCVVYEFSNWSCAFELWDCWGHQQLWNDTARIVPEASSKWILFQGLSLIQTESKWCLEQNCLLKWKRLHTGQGLKHCGSMGFLPGCVFHQRDWNISTVDSSQFQQSLLSWLLLDLHCRIIDHIQLFIF